MYQIKFAFFKKGFNPSFMSGHLNLSMALNVLFVLQSELQLFKEAARLLFWFDRIVTSLNEPRGFYSY